VNAFLPFFVCAAIAAICSLAFAQTPCELVKAPERFKGSMVTVRAQVLLAFEDFRIGTTTCERKLIDDVWLEYGSGPKRQPATWCCGDMIPRDPLPLLQNSDFKRFHRYLTAQSKTSGCHEGQCYVYRVTATLTGRLDTAPLQPCVRGTGQCCRSGFGHFGVHCARLVIHSISDVVAEKQSHR